MTGSVGAELEAMNNRYTRAEIAEIFETGASTRTNKFGVPHYWNMDTAIADEAVCELITKFLTPWPTESQIRAARIGYRYQSLRPFATFWNFLRQYKALAAEHPSVGGNTGLWKVSDYMVRKQFFLTEQAVRIFTCGKFLEVDIFKGEHDD